MNVSKLKELIKERAQIDAQNDILTERSQNDQYNILSLNLSDTIDFLNNCTSEELYWASELFERLREISGLTCDGEALINKMFKKDEPILLFNDWKNESDKNEFDGIKYLFLTLHKMIRKYYQDFKRNFIRRLFRLFFYDFKSTQTFR